MKKKMEATINKTGLIIGSLSLTDIRDLIVDCENKELRGKLFVWALLLSEYIHVNRKHLKCGDIYIKVSLPIERRLLE